MGWVAGRGEAGLKYDFFSLFNINKNIANLISNVPFCDNSLGSTHAVGYFMRFLVDECSYIKVCEMKISIGFITCL